jgi:hypothetical protein
VLRRARLAPTSAELLAALAALATRWEDDPRARAALQLARADADDTVRAAASSRAAPGKR